MLAALTFAGQAVILDMIMGVLILLEGQYYKGDTISVNMVEGVVEEVGIRRTVIRDTRGTLHSISNGLIRSSSNFTRTYAAAIVDVDGVAEKDVEAVIGILDASARPSRRTRSWGRCSSRRRGTRARRLLRERSPRCGSPAGSAPRRGSAWRRTCAGGSRPVSPRTDIQLIRTGPWQGLPPA